MASEYPFHIQTQPNGYQEKLSPDLLNGEQAWLCRGSQNVLIAPDGTVQTRKGMTNCGDALGSDTSPITWADTWNSNTGVELAMRARFDELQVLYNNVWRTFKTGFKKNVYLDGDVWWDKTEVKDKYLFVNGSNAIFSWLGGITEILSGTTTTLTKKFVSKSTATNIFTFAAAGKTITSSGVDAANWLTLGFKVGDVINVGGTTNNNGQFKVAAVSATVITLTADETLVNEVANSGQTVGVFGRETWAAERFAATGTKTFTLPGSTQVYTYTAGENSETLTGITPNLPAVVTGELVFSEVISNTPTGGDIPASANYDILMVSENQVWMGSSQRRELFVSKNTDFKNFGYTTPVRINGEGGTVTLDSELRSVDVSDEGEVHATAGTKDVYKITLVSTTSGDTPGEEIKTKKIKNSQGQSAVNHRAVVNTKNGLMYYSNQPSIDYLARVAQISTQQGVPVSDPILNLILRLNHTNVDSIYHIDNVFFLLPAEGIMLMYDIQRNIWQSPQLVAGSALSIIQNRLVVHSSVDSNSYFMFDGLSDNGKPIAFQAIYGYRNGDLRAEYKVADKYYVEVRMNQAATNVVASVDLGYKGSVATSSATLSIADGEPYVEPPVAFGGIGTGSVGSQPIGGFYADVDDDPILGTMTKVRRIIPIPALASEFFEMRFRIATDQPGVHFQVLAHGDNMQESDTVLSNLIKE